MKKLLAIGLLLTIGAAHAESEIACWNMYSRTGSRPILKAQILKNETLGNVTFNLKDELFSIYFENSTSETYDHLKELKISLLENPGTDLSPALITTNRSPYKGNNEYGFVLGKWSDVSPRFKFNGKYDARLILPVDLSNEHLKSFRIRAANERSNAVMIYSPAHGSDQAGDNYLRMFCVSR